MNVQDVINMALNGQDGRAVEPVEHRTCADEQIAKLASALNFIGANLEDSVLTPGEILAQAEIIKEAASSRGRQEKKKARDARRAEQVRAQRASLRGPQLETNSAPESASVPKASTAPSGPKAPNPVLDYEGAYGGQRYNAAPEGTPIRDTSTRVGPDGPVRTPPPSPEDGIPPKSVTSSAPSVDDIGSGNNISDSTPASAKRSFMDTLKETTGYKRVNDENFLGKRGLRVGTTAAVLGGLGYGGKKLYDRGQQGQQQKSASRLPDGVEDTIAQLSVLAGSAASGYHGAQKAKERMRAAGMSEEEIAAVTSSAGGAGRGALRGLGYGVLGALGGRTIGGDTGNRLGAIGGMGFGAYRGYRNELERADEELEKRKRYMSQGRQKRASVDDVLAYAAHVGKQALLEKVAEDRINPAKISAGSAAPYSGEVMPASSPVFGGQTTPQQLVAMKAQKVRDRINSDMKQYVSNVGEGYNLQGHLNKFNK